jgi:hypothetical protein
MKTKLAFLAAAAALMVPGLALAQTTTATFPTDLVITNGAMDTLNVELTCNNGTPLVQDFDLGNGDSVTFSVQNIDITTAACSIALSGVDAGYQVADTVDCDWAAGELTETNICNLVVEPMATLVEVNTTIDDGGDATIDTSFETVISCMNVNPTTDDSFIDVTVTDTSGAFSASWYADPDGGTDCTVVMTGTDSAVEGDSCSFSFDVGDEEAGCDVEGTVFFEGIPTLSQYGMAIMVLLMLGVGFVGFRRFV